MSMSVARPLVVRPVAPRSTVAAAKPASRAARLVMFSAPKENAIKDAIKDAEETCAGGATGEW